MKIVLKICSTSLLIFLLGCELQFEDNRRALIEGRLNIAEGIDPTLITLEACASTSPSLVSGSDSALIAVGQPNSDGDFRLVSLVPENAANITLFVNCDLKSTFPIARVSSAKISGLSFSENSNNKITIPELSIANLMPFNIDIRKGEEATSQTIFVSFEFTKSPIILNLEEEDDFIEDDFFNDFFEVIFDEGSDETTFNFSVLSNDQFVFKYRILEEGELVEENEIVINVSENNRFLFEF